MNELPTISNLKSYLGLDNDAALDARVSVAVSDRNVRRANFELANLGEREAENVVEVQFHILVCSIIDALESTCSRTFQNLGFCVGGLCANSTLAVKGKTDSAYIGSDGFPALISELKTQTTWPTGECFHLRSRLYQLLAPHYYCSHRDILCWLSIMVADSHLYIQDNPIV